MEQVIEGLLKEFENLKAQYSDSIGVPDIELLVNALRHLEGRLKHALEYQRMSGQHIDANWLDTHRQCESAITHLCTVLEARKNANPAVVSSPIKLLETLVTNHRNLIRSIDNLEDTYGESFNELGISLPRIVVVGEENVGKSSVLESIAGIAVFPRTEGICTRLPFQLRMHHKTPKKMMKLYGHMYPDNPVLAQEQTFVSFETDPTQFYTDPADISARIAAVTQEKTGGRGVKDEVVILNVYSTKVADLTLIDLPGIINARRQSEPEDIYETTVGMVQKYIKQPDTIVLAVIPANIPLVNSQALAEAQKAKALNRTVGVITKVDLATARDRVEQKIMGTGTDTVVLPNGYIGVINQDTVEAQKQSESEFFHQHYPNLTSDKVGRTALTTKLNALLDRHIREEWVGKAKLKIISKQNEIKAKLDALGPPVPSSNVKEFFLKELEQFCDDFKKVLEGKQSSMFIKLLAKFQETFFAARKESKRINADAILDMANYADILIKEEIKERLQASKLLRFPNLRTEIMDIYTESCNEAYRETYEFIKKIVDVDCVELPSGIPASCSLVQEKEMCVICQEPIPASGKGGIVSLHCSATAIHSLHVDCFVKMVRMNTLRCPLCKTPVPSDEAKMPHNKSESIDPVLLFTLKAIAKNVVAAARVKFTTKLETGWFNVDEQSCRIKYTETSDVAKLRHTFNAQLNAMKEALHIISNY